MPLTQRWDRKNKVRYPIKKVASHTILLQQRFNGFVAGADQSAADRFFFETADRTNALFLQRAQELCLHGDAHGVDLVKKKSSVSCGREKPLPIHRASECAAYAAKERALKQVFRNSGAIDGNKFPVLTAKVVDTLGKDFFAGAGLAYDKDGTVCRSDGLRLTQQLSRFWRFADKIGKGVTSSVGFAYLRYRQILCCTCTAFFLDRFV